jgi:hypothetical protein
LSDGKNYLSDGKNYLSDGKNLSDGICPMAKFICPMAKTICPMAKFCQNKITQSLFNIFLPVKITKEKLCLKELGVE